jgi:hypothetical protein
MAEARAAGPVGSPGPRPPITAERYRRARIRRLFISNAAYLIVVAFVVAGLVLIAAEFWRRGLVVIGTGAGVGAVARAVLPDHRAGLLRVRSRVFDAAVLAAASAAMLLIAWQISPLGTK